MPVLGGSGAPLLAAAPAAEELRARAAAILREGGYQAALPRDPVPPSPLELPLGPLELLLRVLLWGAVAALVLVALSWLARRLARAPPSDRAAPDAAARAPAEIPAAGAEALAAQGRFAEAIHALLLDTLAALSAAARLSPSLTSREIAARAALPPPARDALSALVLAVELSRFGGAPAGAEDYRACLGRFHAFLETYRSAA